MKNEFLRKLTLPCIVLMLIFCMILTGCASRPDIAATDFSSACESAGFTVEDVSSQYDPAFVKTAVTGSSDQYFLSYYIFLDTANAKANYAQLLSTVKTGASGEKFVDSTEYNRFYYSNESGLTLLYRNGDTLIYLSGADTNALDDLIDALGI